MMKRRIRCSIVNGEHGRQAEPKPKRKKTIQFFRRLGRISLDMEKKRKKKKKVFYLWQYKENWRRFGRSFIVSQLTGRLVGSNFNVMDQNLQDNLSKFEKVYLDRTLFWK